MLGETFESFPKLMTTFIYLLSVIAILFEIFQSSPYMPKFAEPFEDAHET
jgi:hypothetical protein